MSLRIAILDDEELVRDGIKLKLPFTGIEHDIVFEDEDGTKALRFLKESSFQPVDIFFVDIVMPRMDGLTFVREAKQIWPELRFVIVSGHDDFRYAKTAIQLGVQDYLLKPVSSDELSRLMNVISRSLDEERGEEEERRRSELSLWLTGRGSVALGESTEEWLIQKLKTCDQLYVLLDGNLRSPFRGCPPPFQEEWTVPYFVGGTGSMQVCLSRSPLLLSKVSIADSDTGTLTIAHAPDIRKPAEMVEAAAACAEWIQDHLTLGQYRSIRIDLRQKGNTVLSSPLPEDGVQLLNQLKQENRLETAYQLLGVLLEKAVPQRLKEQAFRYFCEHFLKADVSPEWLQSFADPQEFAWQCQRFIRSYRDELYPLTGKEIVQAVIQSLRQHYSQKKSLQEYADEYGVHPNHLGRLFRQITGTTFLGYLTGIRMEKAGQLLAESNESIADIALETGYEDARYFSQVFRQHYGLTPTEYRKQGASGPKG